MDRLLKVFLIMTAVSAAARAQQPGYQYSIAGDVQNPQTYQYASGTTVHVADLVFAAGIIEPGNALILRGAPLTAVSTERVDPSAVSRGSALAPGDVVIFRSESGLIPGKPNACVLISEYRAVLPLSDGYRSIAELLQQCQLPSERPITVVRTDWGSATSIQLDGRHNIQHSDVVDLSGLPASSLRIDQLFETTPAGIAVDSLELEGTASALSVTPEDVEDDPSGSETLLPPELRLPPEGTEQEADSDETIHNASLNRVLDESADAPPAIAAFDGSSLHSDPAGSAVMNTIFIAGIMFAMGLIMVGWIRTKREHEIMSQIPLGTTKQTNPAVRESETAADQPVHAAAAQMSTIGESAEDHAGSESVIDGEQWYSAAPPAAGQGESTESAAPAVDASGESDAVATAGSEKIWEDLEDLIHNRLPVHLKQSDLPLNVTVFGKPEGPRRLRIDSAHSEISPPHMLKRKQPAQGRPVTAASSVDQQAESESAAESTGSAASRFDRALNFLEEQSDA